jgi:hypothetical protein
MGFPVALCHEWPIAMHLFTSYGASMSFLRVIMIPYHRWIRSEQSWTLPTAVQKTLRSRRKDSWCGAILFWGEGGGAIVIVYTSARSHPAYPACTHHAHASHTQSDRHRDSLEMHQCTSETHSF